MHTRFQKSLQTTVAVPLFAALLFFGAMVWAKSEDPFVRNWFRAKAEIGEVSSSAKASADRTADKENRNVQVECVTVVPKPIRPCPVVVYVHGAGDSLMSDGKPLRQLAELGMVAVSLEYCQTNYEVFEAQFTALLEHVNESRKQKASSFAKATADKGNGEPEQCPMAWVGSSLGSQYTLRFFLEHPEQRPEVMVRLGGGQLEEVDRKERIERKEANTRILFVHGERDQVFPVEECRRVAAMFATNGAAVDLKVLPGLGNTFGLDRAQVIRVVGEYIKAHLTPEQPKPEYPEPPCYPFLVCAMPAFLWAGFWVAKRRKHNAELTADYADAADNCNLCNSRNPRLKVFGLELTKFEIGLRVAAIVLVVWAVAETSLHLVPPRLEVSERTLDIARWKLLAPKWREDFAVLAGQPIWKGQKLKTLLTHVELAHYCVYELINWKLPPHIYRDFVLSPVIEGSETELNWRRPLWEFYYPRIRKENSTEDAARIVVRTLRERITVWPGFDRPQGIDTIWKEQVTGEKGFEKIYVATLRSVGVPARLDGTHKAEFWDGEKWRAAPRPLLSTWRDLEGEI